MPRVLQLPASCPQPWAVGNGVNPAPAAPWHSTGLGSDQLFSVPWGELYAHPCDTSIVPGSAGPEDRCVGRGSEGLEGEVEESHEVPPRKVPPAPDSPGLPVLLPDTTYTLPAAKCPGKFWSHHPQPRSWQLRQHFPQGSAKSSLRQRGSPSPGSAFPSLSPCHAVPAQAVKLQPSFWGCLGPGCVCLGLVSV